MKNIAIILAGGKGSRAGDGLPKQFRALPDGRTVLETCVAAFHQNEHIDEIAVVMLKDYFEAAKALLTIEKYPKVHYWIAGGSERWESSLRAVETITKEIQAQGLDDCNVLIHDCARPFISSELITKVCQVLLAHKAVSIGIPVTDTLYITQNDGQGEVVEQVPPRAIFRRAQTPQSFRLSLITRAYRKAQLDSACRFTDDTGVVIQTLPDEKVYVIEGEESNRKLTFKEDFE